MEKLIVISILLAVSGYGFIKIGLRIRKYNKQHDFAREYLSKLKSYVDSTGRNIDDYGWMIHRSSKMQHHLGRLGILRDYQPPYKNFIFNSYPIILNMLPDLRNSIGDEIMRSIAYQYANTLQETLVRHIGCVEDNLEFHVNDLKNPVKWLREGVREIVAIPVYLLSWLGIVSESIANKVVTSIIFKMLSGILALLGFISALVTIVSTF